jgi:hypothetical protein
MTTSLAHHGEGLGTAGISESKMRGSRVQSCALCADGEPFNILYEITPLPIAGSDSHDADGSFKVISMEKEEQISLMYTIDLEKESVLRTKRARRFPIQ